MSTVPLEIQYLARRLLAFETAHVKPPVPPGGEAVRVFEKLQMTLSKLMGGVGFRALLSRALALAREEVPALGGVHLKDDGSLKGLNTVSRNHDTEAAGEGGLVLLGQFLGLLVTFIGKPLTVRLLRDTWPEVSMNAKDEEEKI
ncbi:MAG: hypothetical protein ACYC9O_14125 [Candidatus Latescibacterota bacterium]